MNMNRIDFSNPAHLKAWGLELREQFNQETNGNWEKKVCQQPCNHSDCNAAKFLDKSPIPKVAEIVKRIEAL